MESKSKEIMENAVKTMISFTAHEKGIEVSDGVASGLAQRIADEEYVWGFIKDAILKSLKELGYDVKRVWLEGDYLRDYAVENFMYYSILEASEEEELDISEEFARSEAMRLASNDKNFESICNAVANSLTRWG